MTTSYQIKAMDITSMGRLVEPLIDETYTADTLTDAKVLAGSLSVRHADRVDAWAVFNAQGRMVWNT